MSNLEIRPRFKHPTELSSKDILNRFKTVLEQENDDVKGYILDQTIYLKIPEADQHYWSPRLNLNVRNEGTGPLEIKGRFGPHPSVWLMFISFYFFLGFVSIIVTVFGWSRWSLGLSSQILWLLLPVLILIIAAFVTARIGQRLGHEQMHTLYDFYKETVKD